MDKASMRRPQKLRLFVSYLMHMRNNTSGKTSDTCRHAMYMHVSYVPQSQSHRFIRI
jgi:hypothetical protein